MKKIAESEKFKSYKTRFKAYAKTRIGLTVVSWCIGLFICFFIAIPIATINRTLELHIMVFITTVCKLNLL